MVDFKNSDTYHHTDHLSGSSVETDKDGLVVEEIDYYPFGSIRTDNQYTAYENKKKFTGYELDDSGLYYAGQRYYMSEVWISPSSILTNYSFCGIINMCQVVITFISTNQQNPRKGCFVFDIFGILFAAVGMESKFCRSQNTT